MVWGLTLQLVIGIAVHMFVDQMAACGLGPHSAVCHWYSGSLFVDQMATRDLGPHSAVCHWYSGSYVCRSNGGP